MTKTETPFDIVMTVAPKDNHTAALAIKEIYKLFHFNELILITRKNNFNFFQQFFKGKIRLIDEDQVITNIRFETLKAYFEKSGCGERCGWYFQQFLKMAACTLPNITDYYLIWDADTVPLKRLKFFDAHQRPLINLKDEFNPPYFETIAKVLGIQKPIRESFIAEHMMINSQIMKQLIRDIDYKNWPYKILDSVKKEHLPLSGFSEFETYGSYIAVHHPNSFKTRKLNPLRGGTKKFGTNPTEIDLAWLSKHYDYVSFEKSERTRSAKRLKYKTIAYVHYLFSLLRKKYEKA